MNPYLQPIELGKSLPFDNPHAVSVSLPTLQNVIGYEENNPEVLEKMQSGYPRFFRNKLVVKLVDYIRNEYEVNPSYEIIPLGESKSIEILLARYPIPHKTIMDEGIVYLLIGKELEQITLVKEFIRHAGLFISSRMAEDKLIKLDIISGKLAEPDTGDEDDFIKEQLAKAYGAGTADDVVLSNCGMNAIYSVLEAILQHYKGTPKQSIMHAGCLYIDSGQLIKKFSSNDLWVSSATQIAEIEKRITENQHLIAAVFAEIPNNPLIECIDLVGLSAICRKVGIPLVVDATMGTPHNFNILPWCDIAVESLTKFACGQGDVIMGAVVFNAESEFSGILRGKIEDLILPPYHRDCSRLAISITNYESRMKTVSRNTVELINYLEKSSAVKELFSVLHPRSRENFLKIRKQPDALPGLISVVFNKDLSNYYDQLCLPKGPSLGTNFTLTMAYVYMAHYDLVKTDAGRAVLTQMGLHPDLLRISVGLEPVDEIIEVLKKAGI